MKIDLIALCIQAAVIAFAWVHIITDPDGIGGVLDKLAAEKFPYQVYKATVGCAPCNSFYWFILLSISSVNDIFYTTMQTIFYICLTLTIAKFLQNFNRR